MNEADSEGGGCTGVNKTDTVTEPKELSFQKTEETLGNYTNKQQQRVAKDKPKGGTTIEMGGTEVREYVGSGI